MAHQRQLIREAVKAQLVGKTGAGTRVFETQASPLRRSKLPAISVYAVEESIDPESKATAPRELTRTLRLRVESYVDPGTNVDDAIDTLCAEIESALDADPTFGGTASDSILGSVQVGIDEEGGRTIGAAVLDYAVTYLTSAPLTAPLDDFNTADVKTSLGGTVHPNNQSEDRIVVQP